MTTTLRTRIARVAPWLGGVLVAAAAWSAWDVRDASFPSLFVDPWGDYSVVLLPHWKAHPDGLRPGARLASIDGRDVEPRTGAFLSDDLAAAASAAPSLVLTFHQGDETFRWEGATRRYGVLEAWWFFGLYALFGCVFLWAGVLTLRFATHHATATAFSFLALTGFVFLVTFYDYNSRRALSPLLATSVFWLIPGVLWLAAVFPRPFTTSPTARALGRSLLGVLLVLGLGSGVCTALRLDVRFFRLLHNTLMVPALLLLAVSMAWRWWRSDGAERREVSAALWGVLVTPAVLAVLLLFLLLAQAEWLHLVLPLAGLVVPASVGWSVLKTDVFDTNAVVHPRLLAVPSAALGAVVGGSVWAVSGLPLPWGALLALVVAVLTGLALNAALERSLFLSRRSFQPVTEALAAQLPTLATVEAVQARVSSTLEGVLPGRRVFFTALDAATGDAALSLPLRSGSDVLGRLHVGGRDDRALLTRSDVALVEVVAVITALTLHNLAARAESGRQRRAELDAQRTDTRLQVDTLAAEVAHELAYPLTYFRHFLSRLQDKHRLPAEELEIGHDEVARLERMVTLVRRFQSEPVRRVVFEVRPVLDRAVALLDAQLTAHRQVVSLDVAPAATVLGDPDLFLQLVANLLRNASQATGDAGRLGVRLLKSEQGAALEVWDSGPGFSAEVQAQLFKPLFSTRPDGSGLGLNICFRIVRSLGWDISAERVADETVFRVSLSEVES